MAEETTEQDKIKPPDDVPLPAEAAATEAATEEAPKPAEAPASTPAEDAPTAETPAAAEGTPADPTPAAAEAPPAEPEATPPAEAPPAEATPAAEGAAGGAAPAPAPSKPEGAPPGPVIVGGTPTEGGAPVETGKPARPPRPKRRRPSAAERHRRAFYSRLTEVRKGDTAPVQPPTPAPAPEAPAPAPEGEAPAPQDGAPEPEPANEAQRSARVQARLVAAVERVGGPEAVREALSPPRREDGQTMKWSAVCCERAEGLKPGDPVFQAWVRLAATPVREVKAVTQPPREDRGPRDDRPAGREELAALGRDGALRRQVRIIGLEDDQKDKQDREEQRRAERDAKRKAEAERLARLGY